MSQEPTKRPELKSRSVMRRMAIQNHEALIAEVERLRTELAEARTEIEERTTAMENAIAIETYEALRVELAEALRERDRAWTEAKIARDERDAKGINEANLRAALSARPSRERVHRLVAAFESGVIRRYAAAQKHGPNDPEYVAAYDHTVSTRIALLDAVCGPTDKPEAENEQD